MNLETSLLGILSILAVGLLVAVTGGVVYLTTLEWRDRRLREKENKENAPVKAPAKPRNKATETKPQNKVKK